MSNTKKVWMPAGDLSYSERLLLAVEMANKPQEGEYLSLLAQPLALGFAQPAHGHLAPAHHLLDDPEHRLHGLLAQSIQCSPRCGLEPMGHLDHRILTLGCRAVRREALQHR